IDAASRLQRLIDDLLAYSKTTMIIEDFEPVDLNIILEELISANKETLEEKQVIIQRDRLPVVRAINFQMRQLFDNLLTNAIKYYHPQRDPLIQVSYDIVPGSELTSEEANPNGNYHKISIIDNGIGFDPAQSDKIFNLFQRLREKTDTSGTGIGLAICRKILQNHKGYIEAVGKLNEGALFFVFLPFDN
ncbi:MAG: ATP-binding protein, partial [Chitinophagaceae bacterium]